MLVAAEAEELQEQPPELLSENAVDDEIDGRVDGDEEIVEDGELRDVNLADFQHTHNKGQHIAEKEDNHNHQQHHRQPQLLLLPSTQMLPLVVRQTNLPKNYNFRQIKRNS